jgi:hypothetical protein
LIARILRIVVAKIGVFKQLPWTVYIPNSILDDASRRSRIQIVPGACGAERYCHVSCVCGGFRRGEMIVTKKSEETSIGKILYSTRLLCAPKPPLMIDDICLFLLISQPAGSKGRRGGEISLERVEKNSCVRDRMHTLRKEETATKSCFSALEGDFHGAEAHRMEGKKGGTGFSLQPTGIQ